MVSMHEITINKMVFTYFWKPDLITPTPIKGKRINHGAGYGLEIHAEYIFYGNGKAIKWAIRTLNGVDRNVKKLLRSLK